MTQRTWIGVTSILALAVLGLVVWNVKLAHGPRYKGQDDLGRVIERVETQREAGPTPVFEAEQPEQGTDGSRTVYITRTGECYHAGGCRYLSRSKIPISLEKAQDRGYRPCSKCGGG